MKSKLSELNILSDHETNLLLNYTGMDKNGFLDFKDFTRKLRPNMIWDNERGNIIGL